MWRPVADVGQQLAPARYLASNAFSLGLCAVTFNSLESCPHGARCAWRHHQIDANELTWLSELGARGEGSVCNMRRVVGSTPVVDVTLWDVER